MDNFEIIEIEGKKIDLNKLSINELNENLDKLKIKEKEIQNELNDILKTCM